MLDIVLIVLAVFLAWLYLAGRSSNLPPAPSPALPMLGHLPLVDKDPRAQFEAWRRRYGDVFSLYMGSRLVVVLNGYDVIKEALVKHAAVFSNRPKMFITDLVTNRGMHTFYQFLFFVCLLLVFCKYTSCKNLKQFLYLLQFLVHTRTYFVCLS